MRIIRQATLSLLAVFGFVLTLGLTAAPAHAQATRTWVSGVGDDVNPCSRTAPCKTFAGAISKTAAGGEINCLDPAGYGAVTITKSITISCSAGTAGILSTGTNAININAGATDKVVIDGLEIQSANTGINIVQARDVVVRNVIIRNSVNNGILVNGGAGGGSIALTVENTTIFNSNVGIRVQSAANNGAARVYDSLIVGNNTAGISVTGAGNRAEISGNQIIRTAKSLDIVSGGAISSYNNNVLSAGDPPAIIPLG